MQQKRLMVPLVIVPALERQKKNKNTAQEKFITFF
jgi:hypothetical protein